MYICRDSPGPWNEPGMLEKLKEKKKKDLAAIERFVSAKESLEDTSSPPSP